MEDCTVICSNTACKFRSGDGYYGACIRSGSNDTSLTNRVYTDGCKDQQLRDDVGVLSIMLDDTIFMDGIILHEK